MYSVSIVRDKQEIKREVGFTTRLLAIENACAFILQCVDHNVSLKVVKTSTGIEVFTRKTKMRRMKINYGGFSSSVTVPFNYYNLLFTVLLIDS